MVIPAFLRQHQLLRDLTHAHQLPWSRQQRPLPISGHAPSCPQIKALQPPAPCIPVSPLTSQTGCPACSSPVQQRQIQEILLPQPFLGLSPPCCPVAAAVPWGQAQPVTNSDGAPSTELSTEHRARARILVLQDHGNVVLGHPCYSPYAALGALGVGQLCPAMWGLGGSPQPAGCGVQNRKGLF